MDSFLSERQMELEQVGLLTSTTEPNMQISILFVQIGFTLGQHYIENWPINCICYYFATLIFEKFR